MNRSNNDIMWDCVVDIYDNKMDATVLWETNDFIESYKRHKGKEVEYNFSHDNLMTVLCWIHKFGFTKANFPVIGKHSRHPMRLAMFAWMKYPYLLFPLRLITILDMIVRHGILRPKTVGGNYHTTGLLKDYYRCYAYDQKVSMWILTKLRKTMFSSWYKVHDVYHGDPNGYNFKVLEAYQRMMAK